MKLINQRDRTIASVRGHAVEFKKGEPTHVPPELYPEVLAAGAVPEDGSDLDLDVKADPDAKKEPADPNQRKAELFAAFEALSLRGKREDFTAGGSPHPKALEKELGWKVVGKERDQAWAEFRLKAEA